MIVQYLLDTALVYVYYVTSMFVDFMTLGRGGQHVRRYHDFQTR